MAPSLADHPQATMSSITLNVTAVKLKYIAHIEELEKLAKYYKVRKGSQMLGRRKVNDEVECNVIV